jgi:hypothetical protein
MLISNNINLANEIVTIRLSTGEEVIAKCVEATDRDIVLSKPVIIQMQMMGPQQAGIGFVPFLISMDEDEKVTIPLAALVTRPVRSRRDVAANYYKMTTGIEMPVLGKGIIT